MNMTENYVSFELAQLLKDKGFESESHLYYSNSELVISQYPHTNNIMQRFRYEAPSLSIAQKWIYENFGIWVHSGMNVPYTDDWYFSCENWDEVLVSLEGYDTPYHALNEGLTYTLKNLIG
jgi:hypothetical protein